jgi:hypothetical protein
MVNFLQWMPATAQAAAGNSSQLITGTLPLVLG